MTGQPGGPTAATNIGDDPVGFASAQSYQMLIDGELGGAAQGDAYEVVNPSTGRPLATVPKATRADVDRAVAAAKRAQPAWNALGLRGRAEIFADLAEVVASHREELAVLDSVNAGNPLPAMRLDLGYGLGLFRDWPALALGLTGETFPASPGNLHYTLLEPYGVVGRIIPFNHPALFALGGITASTIVGNAVVLKLGDQAPLSALLLGALVRDHLPEGVVNIVSGDSDTGGALVTHPDVRRIAFTGSSEVGRLIQRRAAEVAVKRVTLELGGKNPMIVFPDADLEAAVAGAVRGMNFQSCQGQSCGSTSRIFVHDDVLDDFISGARELLRSIAIGPAYDSGVGMGPVVSDRHYDRVLGYIESGKSEGAKLVTGGRRPPHVGSSGYFIEPTLFADVTMDMRIAREEIFGPVMSVLGWSDYETVIAQANDVEYGLTASVWTRDLEAAHQTAARLEAGYIWINDSKRHYWGVPFGGTKSSGLGKEESIDELRGFVQTKAVNTILQRS